MKWIAAIFIALLIIGYLQRKNPKHPINAVNAGKQIPIPSNEPTSGDNFEQGGTIAAGVCEPGTALAPKIPVTTVLPTGKVLTLPVSSPRPAPYAPIRSGIETARQTPTNAVPVSVSFPVVPKTTITVRPPITAPTRVLTPSTASTPIRTYGGGPSVQGRYCYNELDMLANCAAARNSINVGCGSF